MYEGLGLGASDSGFEISLTANIAFAENSVETTPPNQPLILWFQPLIQIFAPVIPSR